MYSKLLFASLCLWACLEVINSAPQKTDFDNQISSADVNLNTVPSDDARVLPGTTLVAGVRSKGIVADTTVRTLSPTPATSGNDEIKYPGPLDTSVIARFFTDIFQIPISVLTAVSNLLSNPFRQQEAVNLQK